MILSGKGGVGKSTLTSQLAYFLAQQKDQNAEDGNYTGHYQVGCLDLDLCGPSIPIMMKKSYLDAESEEENAKTESHIQQPYIYTSSDYWTPHMLEDNLSVMSIGYLLPENESENSSENNNSNSTAVIWRGPKKHELIKKFFKNVDWGTLDYLLIDTPPGTSDEHLSLKNVLSFHPLLAAIIVTTPQEIALQDVRKEIDFCRKVNIPILGVIENMSHFKCPSCHLETPIFKCSQQESTRTMAQRLQLPFLGSLPLDPTLGKACDEGRPLSQSSSAPILKDFKNILSGKQKFPLTSRFTNCFFVALHRNIANLKREKLREQQP